MARSFKVTVCLLVLCLAACLVAWGCSPGSPPGGAVGGQAGPPPAQQGGQGTPSAGQSPAQPGALPAADRGRLLASIPAGALPFPKEQAAQAWRLDGGSILLEQVENLDHSFFLYDPARRSAECIVWFIETASFERQEGRRLAFLARGGSDTGDYEFPYRLWYDLDSRQLSRESLYLPLSQAVAWGKHSWLQVLQDFDMDGHTVVFSFTPHPGEVLAGGHCRPVTTVECLEGRSVLRLRFYGVDMGEELKEHAAPSGEVGLSITPKVGQVLPLPEVMVVELPPGRPPAPSGPLTQGFPYGLQFTDLSRLAERPSIEATVALVGAITYTVETRYVQEGDVLQYVLRAK